MMPNFGGFFFPLLRTRWRLCSTWPDGFGKKVCTHVACFMKMGKSLKMTSCGPSNFEGDELHLNLLQKPQFFLGVAHLSFIYCKPPPPCLSWHVRSCNKMLYYPNVAFCIMWHFGLKCRIVEVFQENGLFQCKMSFCVHNEDTWVWKNILNIRNMLTTSHNMELRNYCPMMILHHISHNKSKNLLPFDDFCWCWKLTSCLIYP